MKNRHLYPNNWEAIAFAIKEKANWECQECGKECRRPGEDLVTFCKRRNSEWEEVLDAPQRFTLTVAHLDHTPANCDPSNLKALCSVCHLDYDKEQHIKTRSGHPYRKRESQGQFTLNLYE